MLACSKIGAVANFLNPMFTAEQMTDRINDTEAELLFVLDKMYPYIAVAIDKTCIKRVIVIPATGSLPIVVRVLAALKEKHDAKLKAAMKKEKYCTWREFIKAGNRRGGALPLPPVLTCSREGQSPSPTATEAPYEKDRPVVMVYSSGTTGASKGIVLTNDGINATITQYEKAFPEIVRQNSILHIVPIWFSTGISISLLMPMCLGVCCILEPAFSNETFTKDIEDYHPSYAFGLTSQWLYALDNLNPKIDLSFFACPMTGGEQLKPESEEKINRYLTEHGYSECLQKGWGMCELGATVAASSGLGRNRLGAVGLPLPLVSVSAFDPETGLELRCSQRGELRVLSPCRMRGYYKNPEATADFFRRDSNGYQWGCTGDYGYVDEDGFVFVLGRAYDCHRTAEGKRVYMFDVEAAILRCEAVEQCKAVAVDSSGQMQLAAHIILKSRAAERISTLADIDRCCRESLAEYAVPRAYKLRDRFPVMLSGKLDAEALRAEREGYISAAGEPVSL